MSVQKEKSENPIVTKSFDLAVEVVAFSSKLKSEKHFDLSSQLFRSGTSIGANVREAQGAESKADFIHKLKVAFKESEELEYWLELCEHAEALPNPTNEILSLLEEVRKLLSSIISSTKRRL